MIGRTTPRTCGPTASSPTTRRKRDGMTRHGHRVVELVASVRSSAWASAGAGVALPGAGLADRLADHPLAQLDDHAARLGGGDELGGRQQAARRMAPSDQGLHAREVAVLELDDRLVVQLELVLANGALEQRPRAEAAGQRVVDRGEGDEAFEFVIAVAAPSAHRKCQVDLGAGQFANGHGRSGSQKSEIGNRDRTRPLLTSDF